MTEQRWTTAELIALRQQGDPLADQMIEEIHAAGGMPAVRRMNAFLQNFNAPIPDWVPDSVRDYLKAPAPLPVWIDPAQIDRARALFTVYALPTLLIFWIKSAAQCFSADNGSHTFFRRKIFHPAALRSFMVEITQLICDVMTEGGLNSGEQGEKGRGIVALQKLRLHHAFVRFVLKNDKKNPWDPAWGIPINFDDTAGFTAAFCLFNLQGLDMLGISLEERDREATRTMWSAMGFYLGVPESCLARELAEAEALLADFGRREFCHSEDGSALAHDLIDTMKGLMPFFLKAAPHVLVWAVMEQRFREYLNIRRPGPVSRFVAWLIGKVLTETHLLVHLGGPVSKRLIQGLTRVERVGSRGEFRLPADMAKYFHLPLPVARPWESPPSGEGRSE